MRSTHHPTADRLEAFVEGTLDPGDRVAIESHMLGCPHCHNQVAEWRALFSTLAALPQFEPSLGFANRVMAHVRLSPRSAWQEWTDRATALVARATPSTNFGWSLAAAFLALPVILGGGVIAWLVRNSYISPDMLWSYTRESLVQGLQGVGSTAITAVIQTDIAAWIVASASTFAGTAGAAGIGAVIGLAGVLTMGSSWVLYRNLFRTPRRDSDYALYSF